MKTENPDVDVILADTGRAVEESIRRITIEKMTVLVEQLFPSWGNPWEEIIFKSFKEKAGDTLYHSVTRDGTHILYSSDNDKGVWFVPNCCVGIMMAQERAAMIKLMEKQ